MYFLLANVPFIFESLIKEDKEYLEELLKLNDDTFEISKFTYDQIKKETSFINKNLIFELTKETSDFDKVEVNFKFDISERYLNFCVLYFTNINCALENKTHFNSYDQILLTNYTEEIIHAFYGNTELCLQYLSSLPIFYGYKEDKDLQAELNSTIYLTLLKMATSPYVSQHRLTFISAIFLQMRKDSKFYVSNINDSFTQIFKLLETLNINSLENFSKFLSYYITNSEFNFKFSHFTDLLKLNNRKLNLFIKMTISKISLISPKSKVEEILKAESLPSYDILAEKNPIWKFKVPEQYTHDTEIIIENIKIKKEYTLWNDNFESKGNDYIYVLASCIFYARSKTLSHLRDTISFYASALRQLVDSQDKQLQILSAVTDVWKENHTNTKFIFECLLNNHIIHHKTLLDFLFTKVIVEDYSTFALIEYLHSHNEKLLTTLRNEITNQRDKLASANEDEVEKSETIGKIEDLEGKIERLSGDSLVCDTFVNYVRLYSSNFKDEIIYERLINFARINMIDIKKKEGQFECLFKEIQNEEIKNLLNTIFNL